MTKRSGTSSYSRRDALRMMAVGGAAGLVAPNLLGKPAFGQTPPSKPTGRIIVGLSQEPTVFNPLMPKIEVDDGVHFSLFDALFRIDPQGRHPAESRRRGPEPEERRHLRGRPQMARPPA